MTGAAPPLRDIPLERILELAERLDVRGPRYTSYPTVPAWSSNVRPEHHAAALERLRGEGAAIAVYVHLPFCRSRCLYCGCNSFITQRSDRMRRYVDALRKETDAIAEAFGGEVRHRQLHLGGGTPTHLPPDLLAELLDHLLEAVPGVERAERSVEVDPRVTTDAHLALLAERGFTRLSAGVQDLDEAVQAAVNRPFSLGELEQFVARSRAAGFAGLNLDLIYGLPKQTPESWLATLRTIASVGPDRLACFGYAHLPARLRHQRAIAEQDLPTPRQRLTMLVEANRFFTEQGYEAVGLDHFARPQDELAVARREGRLWRNFMGYTTTRGLELVGLGSSAISEFDELFVQSEVVPETYADRLEQGENPLVRGHLLDADDRHRKQLINHLMCNLEIDLQAPADATDELRAALRQARTALEPFEAEGLVQARDGGFAVTALGQLFLRNLAMPLDRYLPEQTGTTFSRTV